MPFTGDVMKRLKPYLSMTTVEHLWDHHKAVMAGYGFDRLFYAYTCFQAGNALANPEDALVLSNHPPAYIEAYVGLGLFRDAPMMNWATRNVGSMSWASMHDSTFINSFDGGAQKVLDLNRRFGMAAGYTISFPMAIKRAAAGIGLTARPGMTQRPG